MVKKKRQKTVLERTVVFIPAEKLNWSDLQDERKYMNIFCFVCF